MSPYQSKKVLLASMHQKELAIQEPFEEIVGCRLEVIDNFNTDQFGTFSGEVERVLTAYETLKQKAIVAAEQYNYDYVISSEGAFGPHPNYLLANSDTEMLLFYDRVNDYFISDYEISMETNLADYEFDQPNHDYSKFLEKVMFPSHALILKAENIVIAKGIKDRATLDQLVAENIHKYGKLKFETDMRAMNNPSRMKVISLLANKLAKRVISHCKSCDTPGFGITSLSGYLLCELCGLPTKIKKYREHKCIKCDYLEKEVIDLSKQFADPKYCDYCNP